MDDLRLGHVMQSGWSGDIVLLGFPYDQGVAINNGRIGAAQGPRVFRERLEKFGTIDNPETDINLSSLQLANAGDVSSGLSHVESHLELTRSVGKIMDLKGIPFVVGGGNDQSYPNACALLERNDSVGVVNIDAHLDVRPLKDGQAHSGSPFRLLLDDSRFQPEHFVAFAGQGSQCSRQHAEYIQNKGGNILWLDHLNSSPESDFDRVLKELSSRCDSIFVSFDLDSIESAYAPGVSCPGTLGLSACNALHLARLAGKCPKVHLFDMSEFNPVIEADRTGRLAVSIYYSFCQGVALRRRPS